MFFVLKRDLNYFNMLKEYAQTCGVILKPNIIQDVIHVTE